MNINLSNSGHAYRHQKPDIVVSCSPSPTDTYSSSRLKILVSRVNYSTGIPFMVDWRRINPGANEPISYSEGGCYECCPFDIGSIVEARIKVLTAQHVV